MTYLAVPIKVESFELAQRAIVEAVSAGAELLELRFDYLAVPNADIIHNVTRTAGEAGIPVIATCRTAWEGGHFVGMEEDRYYILSEARRAGADFVDIESSALAKTTLFKDLMVSAKTKVIVSNHEYDCLPKDFRRRWEAIKSNRPVVGKIVYMAKSIHDGFSGLDLLHREANAGRQAIVLAMGEGGVMTRLLAKKLGAFLTFASLKEGAESAPGQISIRQMKEVYRWDHLSATCQVFGVVGSPIEHSMGPALHNEAFTAAKFDGIYLPLQVPPGWDSFRDFMDALRQRDWLNVRGLSVTIPHKANALRYVSENGGTVEALADRIGAINTVILNADETLAGYNTDYAGALDALTDKMGTTRSELAPLRTAIIGAGGVARALVAGLRDQGAKVTIFNRTLKKAQTLAEEFDCSWQGLDGLDQLDAQLLINCTSLGMHPEASATPVPADCLQADMVVFDTVYNPIDTLLLRQGRQAGAQTIDGLTMFVNQAAGQFALFTDQDPPRALMRRCVQEQLEQSD